MLASLIAERYAKALLRAAQAEGALAEVATQAELLRQGLAAAEGADEFLGNPVAEPQRKLEALCGVFSGQVHPVVQAFLQAVLEQKRERYLPVILAAFAGMRDAAEGRTRADIGTVRALSASERGLLEETLSKRLGREVLLKPYTDRDLLGGAVLKMGDTVFDGSLRMRLSKLGRLLSEGQPPRPKSAPSKPAEGGARSKAGPKKPAPRGVKGKQGVSARKKKVTKVKKKAPASKKNKP